MPLACDVLETVLEWRVKVRLSIFCMSLTLDRWMETLHFIRGWNLEIEIRTLHRKFEAGAYTPHECLLYNI